MGGELFWLAPVGSIAALLFAAYLVVLILRQDEGTTEMRQIAQWVRDGAWAYLTQQYKVVSIFFLGAFVLLWVLVWRGFLEVFVPFAFLTGGFFSGLAGFIGMVVATQASARTTNAAREGLNPALRVAFNSGAVMGLVVVGLGLLDLSVWYYLLQYSYRALPEVERIHRITSTMLTFELGASSMALFARVGGGIFTKGADVGADLVGKVEAGIPEDDPRNPAVIADNVGDNVGDVAGMGADLYESYVGSIVATMALGATAFGPLGLSLASITIPMVLAAIGVACSIIGTLCVRSGEDANQGTLLRALRRGVFVAAGLIIVGAYFVVNNILGAEHIGVYWAVLAGLIAGVIIGLATEYFTSDRYAPTRWVASAAQTGPATVVIQGTAVGMMSTAVPVLTVGGAILIAYFAAGGGHNPSMGLYGVGIAAVGMLSTLGITLATDAYGPVADNAGGNAEMSHQPPEVRERTDALDSLGNTTAATGKGFAIGSAALSALALIAAYRNEIHALGGQLNLSLMEPLVLVGLLMGVMLPYVFCSLLMRAVGRAASSVVEEVRRQFREIAGIMEGTGSPDYASCVSICTRAAQREMIVPALLALVTPVVVGWLLGPSTAVALLTGSLLSGFVLAIMMANAGGAWDNAKKFIEAGAFGGKGSDAHKAGVVGDTVGDPFKDTAGPSLNILIKLMSMVSVVLASFVVHTSLLH